MAQTRKVLHVVVGNNDWEPDAEHLSKIVELFMGAARDPLGGVVVTSDIVKIVEDGIPVRYTEIQVPGDNSLEIEVSTEQVRTEINTGNVDVDVVPNSLPSTEFVPSRYRTPLSLQLIVNMRTAIKNVVKVATHIVVSAAVWNKIACNEQFQQCIEPFSADIQKTGRMGIIFGMTIISDAYFEPEGKQLVNGYLAVLSIRDGIIIDIVECLI